jgi:pimeloyl-ACP methyl ester carboxylesterase
MQIVPPPDPIATPETLAQQQQRRNGQIRLPESGQSAPLPSNRDRHLGEHLPAYRAEDRDVLHLVSVSMGMAVAFLCLMRAWECAVFVAALIALNLLAAHYSRQAICPHLFARIVCAVYFSSIRNPKTHQVHRRFLRLFFLPALAAVVLLAVGTYYRIGKPRPPMVDPRWFSRHAFWDVLRENNFFRDPPPPPANPAANSGNGL